MTYQNQYFRKSPCDLSLPNYGHLNNNQVNEIFIVYSALQWTYVMSVKSDVSLQANKEMTGQ